MQAFTFSFTTQSLPDFPGILNASFDGARITLDVFYTFRTAPLTLTAPAAADDAFTCIVRPYRIELSVNDALADEEWPCGEPLITPDQLSALGASYDVPAPTEEPCVTFTGVSDWNPGNGVFVGDCMPFCHEDTFHIFYLKDRHHHQSKWGGGAHQWAHLISHDLQSFTTCSLAVEIDDPSEFSICTGSTIFWHGTYYAFYAIRRSPGTPATLTCSVSDDGIHFKKTSLAFTLHAPYEPYSARDPHVFVDADGLVHMLVTTSITLENGEMRGCLAELTSTDMTNWQNVGPYIIADDESQPECSDFFSFSGFFYRLYALHGTTHYDVASSPDGPWRVDAGTIGENPALAVPKAAMWKGRLIFVGFDRIGDYAGSMHVKEAFAEADGALRIVDLNV